MSTITLDPKTLETPAEPAEPWAMPWGSPELPWSESPAVLLAGDDDLDEDESYFLETEDDDADDEDYDDELDEDEDDEIDDDAFEADDEDEL